MNATYSAPRLSAITALCLSLAAGPALARGFWAQVPGVNVTAQSLDWETVATPAPASPAVAAYAIPMPLGLTNFVHVFFRDKNKCVQHYQGTDRGTDFAPASAVPGPCDDEMDGQISAIAWDNTGRIDLFWFNGLLNPLTLMHRWTDGTHWYKEEVAGTATKPVGEPAVASWGTGRLDLFWRDANNQIRWLGFDRSKKGKPGYTPSGWFTAERVVASNAAGNPTAVERTANIVDLFWRGAGGELVHQYSNDGGTHWSSAKPTGIKASTDPSATSWGERRIDVVYATDATHLGHLWIDGDSPAGWAIQQETLASKQPVGAPNAVSAPSHPGRIDVLSALDSKGIGHTLYQESLPSFEGVGEGSTGGAGLWCSEAAAISVVNYMRNPTPKLLACDGANKQLDMTTCCKVPNAPKACLPQKGGSVNPILDAYNIDYDNVSPLSLAQMRVQLWLLHKPAVSHHIHPDDTGHFAVLTDSYRLHNDDIVVLFDPKFGTTGGYWALKYSEYLKSHFGKDAKGKPNGWKVDGMIANFAKK